MSSLEAVAMSGGVDSSVAALLRMQAGADIVGLTMKLWDSGCDGDAPDKACCTADHAMDAKRVCQKLGATHYTLDLRDEFRKEVVDVFVEEYLRGRTPNPCVRCNTYLKWDALWSRAAELGCQTLTTGHYARIVAGPDGWELRRGQDPSKDQSYFLWGIPLHLLAHTLFPLGDLPKTDTRRLARDAELPTATKSESQDICFVPGGDYRELVRKQAGDRKPALLEPGNIVGANGQVVGTHQGLACYTIGQRRGIGVAGGEPLYVVAMDRVANTLHLGPAEALMVDTLRLEQENWLLPVEGLRGSKVQAQLRYRSRAISAEVYVAADGSSMVKLDSPAMAPAAGQSVVLYQEDRVLGGGVLKAIG